MSSSGSNSSKRERQKQRREAQLAEERAAQARARKIRLGVFALLGVIFAGLVGLAVVNQRAQGARLAEQRAAAEARLGDLGCTPDEVQQDRGPGHLDAATLADRPPEALYPDRPASSGEHFGNWIKSGAYDVLVDERALVHNLEHGYVVAYYNEDAPVDQVANLKAFAQDQIDGDYAKVIVAPYAEALANEANFTYVAWGFRQACRDFDPGVFDVFLQAHHSGAGNAPEKAVPAHLQEGNGTIDPKGEPFLLPPLGDQQAPQPPATEAASEGATG